MRPAPVFLASILVTSCAASSVKSSVLHDYTFEFRKFGTPTPWWIAERIDDFDEHVLFMADTITPDIVEAFERWDGITHTWVNAPSYHYGKGKKRRSVAGVYFWPNEVFTAYLDDCASRRADMHEVLHVYLQIKNNDSNPSHSLPIWETFEAWKRMARARYCPVGNRRN